MAITTRPYHDHDDLRRIVELVITTTAAHPERANLHVGDVLWASYQNTIFDPREQIQLWEEDGALIGMAWGEPAPTTYSLQVHPRWWGRDELEPQIMAWAEQRLRAAIAAGSAKQTLRIYGMASYPEWTALLMAHGYTRTDDQCLLILRQPLPASEPVAALPAGWTVRAVGDEPEWQARVDLHREVWHPSKVTLPAYRRLRAAEGYRPELDLVAVAPDGSLAAYCICWLDPVNRIGEFEPVGTRAAFRGQSLGRAVMQTGLQRLHQHGAQAATVYTYATNPAALALYQSVGFTIHTSNDLYCKAL